MSRGTGAARRSPLTGWSRWARRCGGSSAEAAARSWPDRLRVGRSCRVTAGIPKWNMIPPGWQSPAPVVSGAAIALPATPARRFLRQAPGQRPRVFAATQPAAALPKAKTQSTRSISWLRPASPGLTAVLTRAICKTSARQMETLPRHDRSPWQDRTVAPGDRRRGRTCQAAGLFRGSQAGVRPPRSSSSSPRPHDRACGNAEAIFRGCRRQRRSPRCPAA